MTSSTSEKIELPTEAPVMFLPSVVLLPNVLLPLFIFEPRYRAMLAYALEQQRIFCVALLRPGVDEVRSAEDFHPVCGVGLVRACVEREDGTSHLILQGLARVKINEFTQQQPFRVAEITEMPTLVQPSRDADRLAAQLRKLCQQLCPDEAESRARLEEQIAGTREPAILADIAAHVFLRDPRHQQEILEEVRVEERLRLVLRHLRAEQAE